MIKARIAIVPKRATTHSQLFFRVLGGIAQHDSTSALGSIIALGLMGVFVGGSSAQAQVQRHPKILESREAITTTLPRALPSILQREAYQVDERSPEDINEIQNFVTAWNVVSPNTALFLGEWSSASSNGSTAIWSIYPSSKAGGRVCVLRQRQQPETDSTDYLFGVGHLVTPIAESLIHSTDLIYQLNVTGAGFSTAFQRVTPNDIDTFLTTADAEDTSLDDAPLETVEVNWQAGTVLAEVTVNPVTEEFLVGALSAFPRPLQEPDFGPPGTERDSMVLTYAAAGCTTDLPASREWGIESLNLMGTQVLEQTPGAGFQFNGAYVPVSETGNSVEVYWTVNNQSDRAIAIQPLNIRVETAANTPISCPQAMARFQELVGTDEAPGCARGYLDPFQDGFLEPGDSVSGRVVILRRPEELEGSILVVPDSATGGVEAFRVPIR